MDLPATEMCSKSEWILYSENLMVGVELQMILSFMAKVNKSMISTYSTSLTQQGTTTYGSTQTSSSLKLGKMATIVGDVTGLHKRELRNLNQDEQIVVFQRKTKTWTPPQVKKEASGPWSYNVETADGSKQRRNRVQLKTYVPLPLELS